MCRGLELPMDRTNPNGSGISLGHPIGATGCILTVKALYELKRTGGRRALVTMCIGGGQGIAAIVRNHVIATFTNLRSSFGNVRKNLYPN